MAASFVLHGAIDRDMFFDANGEYLLMYAKIEPFLPQLREVMVSPAYLKSLEMLCMSLPDARNRIDSTRERIRAILAKRAASAQKAG
jgi:hypothetical protein